MTRRLAVTVFLTLTSEAPDDATVAEALFDHLCAMPEGVPLDAWVEGVPLDAWVETVDEFDHGVPL